MGIKLSPPLLDGTIPAFYSNDEGIVITIPFSVNRVVSLSQVDGFQVKIKTVQSGNQLVTTMVKKLSNQENEIRVVITGEDCNKFKVGQYYKIQIAYINQGVIGYYSTVAIAKYTTKPLVSINNLTEIILNSHSYTYTGIYSQDFKGSDKTERVYSYRFDLYNSENEIIDSSGNLLHNNENDELTTSVDSYTFSQDLLLGKTYLVKYTVITTNGLEISSPRYRIMQKRSISPELNATLHATLNYDNGYINIDLKANDINELASGFFMVVRACEDTNYTQWEEIHRFSLTAQIATRHLCKDFTIEQGKNYRYGIQQYNKNNLYSNRILSNIIQADFEDAFLFDGKRQLKIKYNPKVSSFKKNLLETKTDTIGGKHPFIFRNGRVYYSEFPISGLISYQMDEENLFLSEEDYGLVEKTTNLTSDNIAAERAFKIKVLEWLTNGEPKIFRSPAEGNYIVRLMNSSLSPNDTVGRMLHTFSSTAYEIADFNYATLGEMGFITIKHQDVESLQWETVEFAPRNNNNIITPLPVEQNLLRYPAVTIRFDNMTPGDVITIIFANNAEEKIKIGATGSYYIDTGVIIQEVKLSTPSFGSMTYSYKYMKEPAFNDISDVHVIEMPQHQFVGEHDILRELLYVQNKTTKEWIKNPKLELIDMYQISVEKRPLQKIINPNEKSDRPDSDIHNFVNNQIDPFLMYDVGQYTILENEGPRPGYPQVTFTHNYYYDSFNDKKYKDREDIYEPYLLLNGTTVSVNETEQIDYLRPGKITELKSGNGVLVNLSYQMGVITFNIEDIAIKAYDDKNVNHYLYKLGEAISIYNDTLKDLNKKLQENYNEIEDKNGNSDDNLTLEYPALLKEAREKLTSAYETYIIELVAGQKEDARRKGEIA